MALVNPQPHITLGVLGHVDHGKTSLVKALSGMDTDRLEEEKRRGMSIVLGFAFMECDLGVIDLVDVPGHEDFIKTMISGATGLDGVILVIAANEGIKPQTREHYHIAQLLRIQAGVVVITKCDLISITERELLRDQIRDFLAGSFLAGAPVIETSIPNPDSVKQLRSTLNEMLLAPRARPEIGAFYLPLDRVFTMAGFGMVATGTLRNGIIKVGQDAEVMPGGFKVRIRQMQVHKHIVDSALPGQRVAVNLKNVGRNDVSRGDALILAGSLQLTRLLDAELNLLDKLDQLPREGESVHLLFGTTDVMARLWVLGEQHLKAGSTYLVQFVCRDDVVAPVGESFIIRCFSPLVTIGGGRILDNRPRRHKRNDRAAFNRLNRLATGRMIDIVAEWIQSAGNRGVVLQELARNLGITQLELGEALKDVSIVWVGEQQVVAQSSFETLCTATTDALDIYHEVNPSRPGQPLRDLRAHLPADVDDALFKAVIEFLIVQKRVSFEKEKSVLRAVDFNPLGNLSQNEQHIASEMEGEFLRGGVMPPDLEHVLRGNADRERLFHLLTESGILVTIQNRDIGRSIVFHRNAIDEFKLRLESTFADAKTFTVSDVRKLVNTSRKFAVPLLEYLDYCRITIREGDRRRLTKRL